MKQKTIEVQIPLMCGDVQLTYIIVCRNKKQACELLGISRYYLNNYGYCNEPKTSEAIKNPFSKFAFFDSGWLKEYKPEWYRKVLPANDIENYIWQMKKLCAANKPKQSINNKLDSFQPMYV